jgi:hypothetical protein
MPRHARQRGIVGEGERWPRRHEPVATSRPADLHKEVGKGSGRPQARRSAAACCSAAMRGSSWSTDAGVRSSMWREELQTYDLPPADDRREGASGGRLRSADVRREGASGSRPGCGSRDEASCRVREIGRRGGAQGLLWFGGFFKPVIYEGGD